MASVVLTLNVEELIEKVTKSWNEQMAEKDRVNAGRILGANIQQIQGIIFAIGAIIGRNEDGEYDEILSDLDVDLHEMYSNTIRVIRKYQTFIQNYVADLK